MKASQPFPGILQWFPVMESNKVSVVVVVVVIVVIGGSGNDGFWCVCVCVHSRVFFGSVG